MLQRGFSRRQLCGLGLLASALVVPGLRAQTKPEKARVSMVLGSKGSFAQLPLLVAYQLGYFRSEGLDVEITEQATDAAVVQALTSGAADVASAAFDHVIALHNAGQAVQSFVQLGRAPQLAVGVATRQFSKTTPITKIRGQKVGVAAIGSTSHMVAEMVLRRGGIGPQDVSFVAVGGGSGALGALRSAQVEMLCTADPVMTQLEQRGEILILADTRNLKGVTEIFGGPVPSVCLFAPAAFIGKHPNTVQALTNGLMHGLKWLQTAGPSDVIRTVPEAYLLGDRALYLACFEKMRESFSVDGMVTLDSVRLAMRALAGFDASIKTAQISLPATFTNDFAQRAKDKFKL